VYFLGLDVGSLSCDAMLVDGVGRPVAWAVVPTGARNIEAIADARQQVLGKAGIEAAQVSGVVSTGYGRSRVEDRLAAVTEITCHARGIRALLPDADLLVDIGGQDSKAILLDKDGRVVEFAMNDKCAAGTGRFLEAMARALQLEVQDLGELDPEAGGGSLTLSSMCTVFAESEVVSLIADGVEVPAIVSALHRAVAARTQTLIRRIAPRVEGLRVAMSGGVARNSGVVRALGQALGCPMQVPPEPDTVGALGAALVARERAQSGD
jgi:predicted CoA-substrate-specific enzyme activase